jgi:hypothetical protein
LGYRGGRGKGGRGMEDDMGQDDDDDTRDLMWFHNNQSKEAFMLTIVSNKGDSRE